MRKKRRQRKDTKVSSIIESSQDFQRDPCTTEMCSNLKSCNISSVMKLTKTVIYNTSSPGSKNQNGFTTKCQRLEIHGYLNEVEKAREQIRNAEPIEFLVSCREEVVDLIGKEILSGHFPHVFGVLLSFKLIAEDSSYEVALRSHRNNYDRLKEAVLYFCHVIQAPSESVEIQVEASNEHAQMVRQHAELIIRTSGARIRFIEEFDEFKNIILIRGCMDAAHSASILIKGLTPLQLKFPARFDQLDERVKTIAEQMDILLQSRDTGNDTVEVSLCAYEWNAHCLNELRRICLGIVTKVLSKSPPSWSELAETQKTFLQLARQMKWTFQEEVQEDPSGSPVCSPLQISLPSSECLDEAPVSPTPTSEDDQSDVTNPLSPASDSSQFEDELQKLLGQRNLSHFSILFRNNGIDKAAFALFKDKDLLKLGVSSKLARRTMLAVIAEIGKK